MKHNEELDVLIEVQDEAQEIDEKIRKSKVLRDFINLKYKIAVLEERLSELHPEAIEEYKKLFNGQKSVKSEKVSLILSEGRSSYEYSEEVNTLQKKLNTLKKKEREKGIAVLKSSGNEVLRVKFIKQEGQ